MINKAIIIGNLGRDPETAVTATGTPVTSFSVATTEKWKGPEGEQKEQTEWHRVVAFKRLAEICGEYLTKGAKVYIEGRIQTRSWDDKDGNKRYTTEIIAREMKMLGSKSTAPDHGEPMPQDDGGNDVPF